MRTALILYLIAIVNIIETNAQPGTLDRTFGTGGHVALGINFTSTAFQSDGKLVGVRGLSANIIVNRYNIDGTPDPSFGSGGQVITEVGSSSDANAVAITNDGKIIVAGKTFVPPTPVSTATQAFVFVRYNNNGTLDNSFGTLGITKEPLSPFFDANDRIFDAEVLADGRILSLVFHTRPGGNNISIRRYNANGMPDPTFNVGILRPGDPGAVPSVMVIQNDGKIVVGGATNATFETLPHLLLVARRNNDGTPDISFGGTGLISSNVSENVTDIAVQGDGKIVVSGTGNKLLRFNTNGTLDVAFGTGGVVTTGFEVKRIIVQSDGKIITGGSSSGNFAIGRYNSNGTADASFGTEGMVTSDFGSTERIENMAVVGDRLYAYGQGILAAYLLTTPVVGSESNTSSGTGALVSNTTGTFNTATGFHALISNTTGSANTAYGAAALQANVSGNGNTGIGYNTLFVNTTGNNNTATGAAALALNTNGSNNVAFGVGAGFNSNNFSSTFLGTFTDAVGGVTNSTALGFQAIVNASNQVRIGNSAVTSIGGFSNWTNMSDGRFKKNVNEDVPGLAFITKLRPVTYTLDIDHIDSRSRTNVAKREDAAAKEIKILPPSAQELQAKVEKAKLKYTGFIAQEVEQAAKKLNYEFSGVDIPKNEDGYYGLRYAEFVVPLVKAVQEQQKQIEELKQLVAKLSSGHNVNDNTTNNTTIKLNGASLEQNFPNPHSGNTIVRYHLPEGTANAKVVITNMKGQVIKSIDLNSKGDGQLTLNASTLAAGSYTYSLWVDGKEVDVKRMLISR